MWCKKSLVVAPAPKWCKKSHAHALARTRTRLAESHVPGEHRGHSPSRFYLDQRRRAVPEKKRWVTSQKAKRVALARAKCAALARCADRGSNTGPLDLQSNALPTELSALERFQWTIQGLYPTLKDRSHRDIINEMKTGPTPRPPCSSPAHHPAPRSVESAAAAASSAEDALRAPQRAPRAWPWSARQPLDPRSAGPEPPGPTALHASRRAPTAPRRARA